MELKVPTLDDPSIRRDAGQDGIIELDSPPESLVVTGVSIAAGVVTRRCLAKAWKKAIRDDPPINPAGEGITWTSALIWAVSVGAAIGVARVCARRGVSAAAAKYYY